MERNSIDAALQTVNQIKKIRGYYIRYIVKDVVVSQSLRPGINHQEDPRVIPLPAAFVHDVSALMAAERSSFTLYSPYPFPDRAERRMDGFVQDGETFLRVAVADRMVSEVCVSCHNSHAASPKSDWQLGDVRGIVEVRQNICSTLAASGGFTRYLLAGLGVASAVLLAAVLFAARAVTRPVANICTSMKAVAAGNLDITIAEAGRQDEIGAFGRTIVEMQGDLKKARKIEEERAETQARQQQVVDSLRTGLSRLSNGDFAFHLTEAFPDEHEGLRQDFNQTSETLSSTVAQVIEAAGSIRNGAAEISQASDDLSHRTESQAATLEQTAAALDELTASVKSAAEGAGSVGTTMEEARLQAETNRTIVQNAVSAMAEIEQSSNHISQILCVIDDIAFQTNLLALNAGVEAARAGEAGRGFRWSPPRRALWRSAHQTRRWWKRPPLPATC